jgi:EpsI family protein
VSIAKRLVLLAIVLVSTAGMKSYLGKSRPAPPRQKLEEFPRSVGSFSLATSNRIPDDQQAVLKADDTLLRTYRGPQRHSAELFVAYYEVQRAGESMHSPKNCLPGSGWEPITNDVVTLTSSDGKKSDVNRYIIEKDGYRALVLYWFQSHGRVIASEYWGKFYLVADALRTGRRDGAIVRVVVPLDRRQGEQEATTQGLEFASAVYTELPRFIPN